MHVHEPGQRVRTVASSLGTSQHFDSLHVEQGCDCADTAEIDVVNQEADRRIGCALVLLQFANTANLQVPGSMPVPGPVQVRHHIDEFFEMLERVLLEFLRSQYRDARRQLTDRALTKIGRYNDFLQRIGRDADSRDQDERRKHGT